MDCGAPQCCLHGALADNKVLGTLLACAVAIWLPLTHLCCVLLQLGVLIDDGSVEVTGVVASHPAASDWVQVDVTVRCPTQDAAQALCDLLRTCGKAWDVSGPLL